ncbi:hypothetical protein GH714_006885 [Hevea brasiliensis]|uniref:Uncharacterized protein n=1 Tax=Hevea brasiliensis TaxID=3981 RepID=A0A6A6LR84_HEVBR|nr:hypothetical protein GH714_006885 [Hevea brasiliensis]
MLTPAGEEVQIEEQIPFVDFKRRSEVRKAEDDANPGSSILTVETHGFSDGQQKRRKLIRPNFSMNESSGNVMVGSQDKKGNISQVFELPHFGIGNNVVNEQNVHFSCEEKNVEVDKDSNYERGECESCKDEEHSTSKNFEDDGSSPNHDNTVYSNFQEKSVGGIAYVALDCDGDSKKSFQNVELENKALPAADSGMMSSTTDNAYESEKLTEELGDSKGSKRHLSVESVTVEGKAFVETVSCLNMQEPSEGIGEGNGVNGELLHATAGKDCKMNFEDNVGNGNKILPVRCETMVGHSEICLSNQQSSSFQEVEDIGFTGRRPGQRNETYGIYCYIG